MYIEIGRGDITEKSREKTLDFGEEKAEKKRLTLERRKRYNLGENQSGTT